MDTDRFGKHISLIYRYSQIFFNPLLNKYNLGSGQYQFLMTLYDNNGIIQEQLSKLVKLDKATTARAIKKLEKEGYVFRMTSEDDKRAQKLYTTKKAAAVREYLENVLDSWNKIMLENFSQDQKEQLFELIEKVGSNIINYFAEQESN
ncbi:MAG: MarR family transcriptional regulator [Clostridiales bacterium]|nr:MarR family transcriptional regulator [Eubacteriales bacterium]MDH7565416.1 MarR family transcriptional regulator [Clostridiales bacterium]